MGSFINFKNYGDTTQPDGNGGKPTGSFPLARQSSIYSLTFDELQNTYGGLGKDFGSMNVEDLLKNIWTAEETQAMASSARVGDGNLQRQGSLTLPRTLSMKTVDEVWRDLFKESSGGVKTGSEAGGSNLGLPSEPTLGEITLEEFLLRAGVEREDIEQPTMPNTGGFYGGLAQPSSNSSGLNIAFQQPGQNQFLENSNPVPHQQQSQPLFPKQTTLAFSTGMQLGNNTQLACPKGPILGMTNPSLNTTLVQGGVMQNGVNGLVGLRPTPTSMSVARGSPAHLLPSDVKVKSNLDVSSLSGSPYAFSEEGRGRRSGGPLEKVVERRRKRMIKNRESAARSRARKQAYTIELEEEISKLKEINQELKRKQAEFMEMQKNQILETMKIPQGGKKRCLRRTLTGPW